MLNMKRNKIRKKKNKRKKKIKSEKKRNKSQLTSGMVKYRKRRRGR